MNYNKSFKFIFLIFISFIFCYKSVYAFNYCKISQYKVIENEKVNIDTSALQKYTYDEVCSSTTENGCLVYCSKTKQGLFRTKTEYYRITKLFIGYRFVYDKGCSNMNLYFYSDKPSYCVGETISTESCSGIVDKEACDYYSRKCSWSNGRCIDISSDQIEYPFTLDANGGTFPNGNTQIYTICRGEKCNVSGSDYIPKRANYTFNGWMPSNEQTCYKNSINVKNSNYFKACWIANGGGDNQNESNKYYFTLNVFGGTFPDGTTKKDRVCRSENCNVSDSDLIPTRKNYSFNGWMPSNEQTCYKNSINVKNSSSFTACWKKNNSSVMSTDDLRYEITEDTQIEIDKYGPGSLPAEEEPNSNDAHQNDNNNPADDNNNKINDNNPVDDNSNKTNDNKTKDDNEDLKTFCNDPGTKKLARFIAGALNIFRLAIPLLIIIHGSFDFGKVVIKNNKDELKNAAKNLGIRVAAGVLIFFLPTIIWGIYGGIKNVNNSNAKDCFECLINNKCDKFE